MRRRLALIPFMLLGSLALATGALAGGWAQVALTDPPVVDPPAGVETPIGLTVMQHGKTAVSWPSLTVVATDADSGAVVRVKAIAEGPVGAYVAKIVFPTAGTWTLAFESNDLMMEGAATLFVTPDAAVAPAAVTPVSPAPASPAPAPDLTPFGLVAALGVALMVGGGLALRGRRSDRRDAPVSAAN